VTETEIAELRSRIAELEERDEDFARKSNLLLDEILLTREQADKNTVAIENLVQVTSESRRDIDQLATRMGELAQSVSELRQNQQLLTFTVTQVAESITILRQSQQTICGDVCAIHRASRLRPSVLSGGNSTHLGISTLNTTQRQGRARR
jgi:chromosome segregation ATPase